MASKKTLELNSNNAIVKELRRKVKPDKSARDLTFLFFEMSLPTSGFSLDDPMSSAEHIYRIILFGLDDDKEAEEAVALEAPGAAPRELLL